MYKIKFLTNSKQRKKKKNLKKSTRQNTIYTNFESKQSQPHTHEEANYHQQEKQIHITNYPSNKQKKRE